MSAGAVLDCMSGLRFFVCEGCDTVYADLSPPAPGECCPDTAVTEIMATLQSHSYSTRRSSELRRRGIERARSTQGTVCPPTAQSTVRSSRSESATACRNATSASSAHLRRDEVSSMPTSSSSVSPSHSAISGTGVPVICSVSSDAVACESVQPCPVNVTLDDRRRLCRESRRDGDLISFRVYRADTLWILGPSFGVRISEGPAVSRVARVVGQPFSDQPVVHTPYCA